MRMSQLALDRLTKPWEEFVGYPYDDKVGKVKGLDGKRRYPEWKGGPVRGTITIGYGHTDAAGAPKIEPGLRVSLEEATQILADDIRPCERAVARMVKVPLGQHQFDTLTDFVFNAGDGTLGKSTLLRKLNEGDYDAIPAELMKFTLSKGEHMEGLTHRRQAEIAIWNTPDEKPHALRISPEDRGLEEDDVHCPKGEGAASRSAFDSKEIAAGTTVAIGTIAKEATNAPAPLPAHAGPDPLDAVHQAQDQLQSLGLWDTVVSFLAHHQSQLLTYMVVGLVVFMVAKRFLRLKAE